MREGVKDGDMLLLTDPLEDALSAALEVSERLAEGDLVEERVRVTELVMEGELLELREAVSVTLTLELADSEPLPDTLGEVLGETDVVGLCEEERELERVSVAKELVEGEEERLTVTDCVGLPLGLREPVRLPDCVPDVHPDTLPVALCVVTAVEERVPFTEGVMEGQGLALPLTPPVLLLQAVALVRAVGEGVAATLPLSVTEKDGSALTVGERLLGRVAEAQREGEDVPHVVGLTVGERLAGTLAVPASVKLAVALLLTTEAVGEAVPLPLPRPLPLKLLVTLALLVPLRHRVPEGELLEERESVPEVV